MSEFIAALVVCSLVFLFGCMAGGTRAVKEAEQTAIKAGVAYYAVNPATGETKFKFITEK